MRFSALSAIAVLASSASAASLFDAASVSNAAGLSSQNHYGAPTPPWKPNHSPGWYYGHGTPPKGVKCVLNGIFCELLELFHWGFHCPKRPHHPTPPHYPPPPPPPTGPPGYGQTFYNLTCASQDDAGAYMTYGLVDTVADCADMCDTVDGCAFFNSYHDNNAKDGSTQLTCALFNRCLTPESADNCGGQTQPDGSISFITASDGYCKK
ncbi:hypothetical protein C8J57DRAFT_364349 [Mycena rebaudengoi]|nr:hypothetical protein C8J57DRAFT_364349 [Mycena rebaudengoi]